QKTATPFHLIDMQKTATPFHHAAQGRRAAATLGTMPYRIPTPTGLHPNVRHVSLTKQTGASQKTATPFHLIDMQKTATPFHLTAQGRRAAATLGTMPYRIPTPTGLHPNVRHVSLTKQTGASQKTATPFHLMVQGSRAAITLGIVQSSNPNPNGVASGDGQSAAFNKAAAIARACSPPPPNMRTNS
ncbi:MAG: hypothetical protein MUF86_16830, partial [Akkermansiaceae bacterium]|nr:hypothetical protein [Akkermansiaceae bacterium]